MSQPCSAWFNGQKTALLHNQHLQGGKKRNDEKRFRERQGDYYVCILAICYFMTGKIVCWTIDVGWSKGGDGRGQSYTVIRYLLQVNFTVDSQRHASCSKAVYVGSTVRIKLYTFLWGHSVVKLRDNLEFLWSACVSEVVRVLDIIVIFFFLTGRTKWVK